ncbi:hypothetical protein BD410DRAFT_893428 [Rickenella mellea]|uniref:Uncharacterized protein n=1 Tax=Rickenella mellea TaxID=50990 RepID=A0A4Y7QLA8_9AGAM|nr:hypothetical protein BD410DRAFT_893428 [Rickenella mellea]
MNVTQSISQPNSTPFDELGDLDTDFQPLYLAVDEQALDVLITDLQESVDTIKSLVRDDAFLDVENVDVVNDAARTVISFENAIILGNYKTFTTEKFFKAVTSILDAEFLGAALQLRRLIVTTATAESEDTDLLVTCWVDHHLANLEDIIGDTLFGHARPPDTLPPIMKKQRWEERLRVAAQLPHSLQSFLGELSSAYASPAAKRQILTALFAALILCPDFGDSDPWAKINLDPSQFLRCIHALLNLPSGLAPSFPFNMMQTSSRVPSNIESALIISLYACADTAVRRTSGPESSFRPHTANKLINMISGIMYPSDTDDNTNSCATNEFLTFPQEILVYSGNTVSWCWHLWSDPRTMDFEANLKLTIHWLMHLMGCPDIHESVPEGETNEQFVRYEILRHALQLNIDSSLQIFTRLLSFLLLKLHTLDEGSDSSTVDVKCLYWSVWSLCEVFAVAGGNSVSGFLQPVTTLFVEMMISLRSNSMSMKLNKLVLRFLTTVARDVVLASIRACRDDPKVRLLDKLDDAIATSLRFFTARSLRELINEPDRISEVISLLNLVTISLDCGFPELLSRNCASLLSTIADALVSDDSAPSLSPANELRHCVLLCITAAKHRRQTACLTHFNLDDRWKDDTIFRLTVDAMDLRNASAFACYVSHCVQTGAYDPLFYVEAWDYLRDKFLAVLDGDGVEELHDVILSPILCVSLIRLSRCMDKTTASVVLDSPLTLNLRDSLRKLMTSTTTSESSPSWLRCLVEYSRELMELISHNFAKDKEHDCPKFRLIYDGGRSQLLMTLEDISYNL